MCSLWLQLISGHKLWAVLPADSELEPVSCDPSCSHPAAATSPLAWFLHLLPQLQTRQWYGTRPAVFIQGPGETLVLPGRAPHAVLNLDWTLGRQGANTYLDLHFIIYWH